MDASWIVVFIFFIIVFVILPQRRRRVTVAHRAAKNMRKKGFAQMEALAKQFLDKECVIYTVSDTYGDVRGFIREVTDGGPIILQKAVEVKEGDTPETLQRRVMEEAEWQILPKAISLYCEGRLSVEGRIVHIKESSEEQA